MILKEYIEWTKTTWVNKGPFDLTQQANCVFGIGEEWGEFVTVNSDHKAFKPKRILSEAADCLYYTCRIIDGLELGVAVEDLVGYEAPDGEFFAVRYGRLCGHYKRILRGDFDLNPGHVRPILISILRCIVNASEPIVSWEISGYDGNGCRDWETNERVLERLIKINVEKLEARYKAGKIVGSGEER